jgi:hypothetical protein
MAGRQKHSKRTYSESSPIRYQGKMYALFKSYMGPEYAKQLASAMYRTWDNAWVKVYHKVNSDPSIVAYMSERVPSAMQFIAYQLMNEFVSSVMLTRNETAGMVAYKYKNRGLPSDVVQELMYRVASVIGPSVPEFMQSLGDKQLNADNVVNLVNQYVLAHPPLPRSRGGKGAVATAEAVPSLYAGTTTWNTNSGVESALNQELQEAMALTR